MDNARIDRLVNAVLYEGYLLYPYRPSLKNAKRWTFGALYPAASQAARSATERSAARARVLVAGDPAAEIGGELRFLHLIERRPSAGSSPGGDCWHDCEERRVAFGSVRLDELLAAPRRLPFAYARRRWGESGIAADASGAFVYRQKSLRGTIELSAQSVGDNVRMLCVSLTNDTPCDTVEDAAGGDAEVLKACASAHVILRARGARFLSRIDPPEPYRQACPDDPRDGLWPVLLGDPDQADTMLCSPIVLYDYPEVAPESTGDFFDATEMDEMLTLRVMTLSDEEKQAVASHDKRGRALLERTEQFARQQLAQLHGATRSLRFLEEPRDER